MRLQTLICPFAVGVCVVLASCATPHTSGAPSWNITRTVIYEFSTESARDAALAEALQLFIARGFHLFDYPEGAGQGYERAISGTHLTLRHSFRHEEGSFRLTFTLHSYIPNGDVGAFTSVTQIAHRLFEDLTGRIHPKPAGPYFIPGP